MPTTQGQVIEQAVLDESVRMVMVQSAFSDPSAIPKTVRQRRKEPSEELVRKNKERVRGKQVIELVKSISLASFLDELEQAGYVLFDAFSEQRRNTRNQRPHYYMVRFSFMRKEDVESSEFEEFEKEQEILRHELWEICNLALWSAKVFRNPFFWDGKQILGQYSVCINLEAGTPHPTTPNSIPLTPKGSLRIVDNSIQLLPA